jgi:hypothetical protein
MPTLQRRAWENDTVSISGARLAALPVDELRIARSLVLDWHDGPREGFIRFDEPASTWHFRIFAEAMSPDDLDRRLFLLAAVPENTFPRLLDALRPLGDAGAPHWTPIWQFPDDESRRRAETVVDELIGLAPEPDVVIASQLLDRVDGIWLLVP